MPDRLLLLAALLPLLCAPSAFAAGCDGLSEGPDGTVVSVEGGDMLTLDSGIVVRLANLEAPQPAARGGRLAAEPLAGEAAAALSRLVLGKSVEIGLDAEETDRYGRMEGQVFLADGGAWVQQELLAAGMARVEPSPADHLCLDQMLAAEAVARSSGLGIWADPYYSVRKADDPDAIGDRIGHYEVIEGEVVSTGESRGRIYLDFGPVWKTDLTATIDGKARQRFAAAGLDPLALRGQRVRIRGWLESRDGPLIELATPGQIEVLGSK